MKPMLGLVFGRLKVIAGEEVVYRMAQWLCECSCGRVVTVPGANLRRGKTKSCGCLRKEKLVERWAVQERKPQKVRAPRKRAAAGPARRKEPVVVKREPVAAEMVVELRPGQVVEAEMVVELRPGQVVDPRWALARAMRMAGARWSEVMELTGLSREEVLGV